LRASPERAWLRSAPSMMPLKGERFRRASIPRESSSLFGLTT
jgi:hypothetical protein